MSQRITRVNELLRLEMSEQLHTRWSDESVRITITSVEVSPDLHDARVFYSVLGEEKEKAAARAFLNRILKTLRMEISKRVILKYTPRYRFIEDKGVQHGVDIVNLLDRVEKEDRARDEKSGRARL